jgi:GNAT superfamily N-acetyltransferase
MDLHSTQSRVTTAHTEVIISPETPSASLPNPFAEILKRDVTFRRVTSVDDSAAASFIEVYQKAFSGAPYFEKFDADFVHDKVWKAHQGQLIITAEEKGVVCGLVCAHRLSQTEISPSACEFINEQSTLYFSELAVLPSHQGMGIGSVLVASALTWACEKYMQKFVLRTAAQGSNSSGIFKKFGAHELKLIQDVMSAEAGGPESASNKRIYLAGQVTWHGDYLARLGDALSPTISAPSESHCHS